jgi:CRISPR/Cas system Type II protein with McrA/HNH and RuvC-like nuclease domain
MCYACWFRKICIDRTGNAKLAKEIQALFDKQGGKCAYTGEPIQLGANAQLDHKTPTPRGGKDVIDNLHWVSASVNLMKGQRTHKEFVALCKHIANRFS